MEFWVVGIAVGSGELQEEQAWYKRQQQQQQQQHNNNNNNHFKIIQKYISNIPGNHEVKELQKTAILGTAHILRKVLT